MLKNYVNINKNIIIVGGTEIGRQKVLLEAVNMIDSNERVVIVEEVFEIPKEKLFNNFKNRNIISVQTNELSIEDQIKIELLIDRNPQNAVAISSIEDIEFVIKCILPIAKYTIMTCDKLIDALSPYADVVVKLKDDDTLDFIKEMDKYQIIKNTLLNGDICEMKTLDNKIIFGIYMDGCIYKTQDSGQVVALGGFEPNIVAIRRPLSMRNAFECFKYGDLYNYDYTKYGEFDTVYEYLQD
ncbi:TPA: hypothetical protein N2D99_002457 [Clostridium botulinum]|nr:hypothetical protein [Clostridium botulinum]